MDWFRNVPNVIRSSSAQSDHGLGSSRNNSGTTDSHPHYNSKTTPTEDPYSTTGYSSTSSNFTRKTSKEENGKYLPQQNTQGGGGGSKNSSVRKELTCALCGEMYTDPRILPCLHSFCKRCLEHTVNPRSTMLVCHLCRKEIKLKMNGIAEFPQNFVINNLIDVESVRNSTAKPMLCSSCNEHLPATARCLDCMDFLCYACHNAHSRVRMTKDHKILTLEQLKRSSDVSGLLHRPVFCRTHKEEKVSYYCSTCNQTICRECVITNHQQSGHDYTLIEHALEGQMNEITSLKKVIDMKLPLLSRSTSQLLETQQKLDSRSNLIKSEIEDRTPRLIKLIEEKEMDMMNKLTEMVQEKKGVLQKQLEQLQIETNSLRSLNEFAEQVIKTGTSAEILSLKQALCEKLKAAATSEQSYEPQVDDQISCDTDIDTITNAIQRYGQLSTSGEVFLKCFVLGDVTTAVKGQSTQLTLVIKNQFGVETPCPKEDIEVEMKTPEFGVLIPEVREKGNATFTVTFRTYSLGVHQLSIKLKGKQITGSPYSINVISNDRRRSTGSEPTSLLKESDGTNNNKLSAREERSKSSTPDHSYSKPLSLDINEYHYNYRKQDQLSPSSSSLASSTSIRHTTTLGNDRITPPTDTTRYMGTTEENLIMKTNTTSLLLNTAPLVEPQAKYAFSIGRRGTGIGEFHGVFGVASDHINKRIVATDCHNNRIQVFDEDGRFLFTFGQKGGNDGEFQNPTGVGVGPNGEIVVCERLKGRIQVFNSNGNFQRRFLLNQLKASTLAVDIAGRIIIADYTSCCIYILDPILERWSKFGHFGQGEGELQYPCYVTTDLKGNIFVSDMNSNKIQMYDSESTFIRTFGNKGDNNGEFHHPTGIAIDIKGRLIVADRDNHRIQVIETSGNVGHEYVTKFGSKTDLGGELSDLHGVAVLSNGNIAAADLKNNRIAVFSFSNNPEASLQI